MHDIKIRRLDEITHEVNHFHPLLKKLLPRLKNVKNVDYTHGRDEMGADFVVTMEDETFSSEYYAGVIAKVGNIDQADVEGIEKQIKECELERLTQDSRKTINITEIWIATNGTISTNAQRKLNHLFAHRSLKFIYRPRLIKFIDSFLESYWTDVDLEIAEYLARTAETNDALDKNISLLQIGSSPFYIEQDVVHKEPEGYGSKGKRERVVKNFNLIDNTKDSPVTVIESAAGMGKSKLLRNVVRTLASPTAFLERKALPVYVSYSAFVTKHGESLSRAAQHIVGEKTLAALGKDVKLLFLIDGMDEKDASYEEQQASISAILKETAENESYRVVATTRYLSSKQEAEWADKKITIAAIRELSLKKIIEFLSNVCTHMNLSARIVQDLKRSSLFKELPRSPIAAILLGRLLRDTQKELPSNLTSLYGLYIEVILGRWDIDKGLQSQAEFEALDVILTDIATYFMDNELSYISIDEAAAYFHRYLDPRNIGVTADALFQKMVNRCEIVFVDTDRNRLGFKHRTFAEFLYARRRVRSGKAVIEKRALDVYWMNSYFFMAGILKDCPDFLDQYVALKPDGEYQQWIKLINTSNMLLAGYTTHYIHIESGIKSIFLEAAKLYKDAIDGKVELEVAKARHMSAIELLGLCQYVMKDSYSFPFFQKAIESTAYALESDDTTKDYRPYALFFLYTTSLALEKPEVAELVIKTLGADIPLAVRLGLHIETKSTKEKSAALKKLDKHTVDILKTSRKTNHQARALFETPLFNKYTSESRPSRKGK